MNFQMVFGTQHGADLDRGMFAPKWDPKMVGTLEGPILQITYETQRKINMFGVRRGPSWRKE